MELKQFFLDLYIKLMTVVDDLIKHNSNHYIVIDDLKITLEYDDIDSIKSIFKDTKGIKLLYDKNKIIIQVSKEKLLGVAK